MGRLWIGLALGLAPWLVGCGGGQVTPEGELPVACVTKLGRGHCEPGSGRFYYDYRDNRCKPTGAGGCAGRTLFDSLDACVRFCGAGN